MKNIKELDYEYNEKIVFKEMPEMLMAYNQDNGDMHEFNSVGGDIFKKIYERKSIADIFKELEKEYSVTEEDIMEDVTEIINRMLEIEIIKPK